MNTRNLHHQKYKKVGILCSPNISPHPEGWLIFIYMNIIHPINYIEFSLDTNTYIKDKYWNKGNPSICLCIHSNTSHN